MAQSAPLPSGPVTLLFTDIEGSTRHWEERPDEMSRALRRHDALLRAAIEAHNGRVFKTVGDAFFAVFWQASDAVSAAEDAQRALEAQDWNAVGGLHVRMAVHSGAADERDGDYFGRTVNRIARLLAVVHGGQVVISGSTAQLLHGTFPSESRLRDLGEHPLKDLVEPERIWQLLAPGLPDAFPPLQSLDSLPNNLPRQVTPLIGREEVLAEIEPLVLEYPLVSLVGTGGIGKTRLALQVGANLLDGSGDGVWLVELAPLSDPASVANTIASTFGLRVQGERPMLDALVQYLRPRRLLLILDNCEHLIDEAARVADAILRAAPDVRILATSREPLRITGERVYRVPSLTVPQVGEALTADRAREYGAIVLFTQRATAGDAKFTLTDENAPIVGEICRRLDGIALAIELAAVRVKVLPPRQLAQKLDECFRVLTRGSRTALPRQKTMHALIDWSHELLSEREQRLFRRLAIFTSGWTLQAAEVVCGDETLDALDVIDLVASLVEKSLVVAEVTEDPRYRLLESTRTFAMEKLAQSGERDALARRHAQWAADLADRAYAVRWLGPMSQWQAEFAPDLENVRSAIDWALSRDEVVLAVHIAVGFSFVYRRLVGQAELRSWLQTILERLDAAAQPELAARAWHEVSIITVGSRKIEAAERAVELGERCNEPATVALSLASLAEGLRQAGRAHEAQPVIDRAVRLSNESGLSRSSIHANALNAGAIIARACGRLDESRQRYAEALALATSLGDEDLATLIPLNIAELEFEMGNPVQALALVTALECETRRPLMNRNVMVALLNGAAYRIVLGDFAAVRTGAGNALRLGRGAYIQFAVIAIGHLATVAAHTGDPRRGARLRGYVDAWYRSQGYERELTEQRTYEVLMTALREKLSDAELEMLAAEGAQLSEDEAVAEAFAV